MPVSPPYSIIDTIARLRSQSLAPGIESAASSIGSGLAKGNERAAAAKAAAAKQDAAKYHDATMFADKNFDWAHSPQAGAPGAPPPPPPPPGPPGPPGGAPPPPGGGARPPGSVTMNDIYLAHGLKPVQGGDTIIGTAKAAQKAEAAGALEDKKIAGQKDIAAGKEKAAADAAKDKDAAKFDATHMEVDEKMSKLLDLPPGTYPTDFVKTKISVSGRDRTSKTAATAKTDSAQIAADAKRDIAEISFRLKSPDHQIQLQAMKDRDAYITKHPTSSALFGTPKDLGKTKPTSDSAAKPADAGGDDLDALMVKHGGQ